METAGDEEDQAWICKDESNAVVGREKAGLQVDERRALQVCQQPGGIGSLPGDGAACAKT